MFYNENNISNTSEYFYDRDYNFAFQKRLSFINPTQDIYMTKEESLLAFMKAFDDFDFNKKDSYNDDDKNIEEKKTNNETKITTHKKEKIKIFNIKKASKNAGRRKKDDNKEIYLMPIKHGKNAEDNIRIKIKTYFIKRAELYINNKYADFLKRKKIKVNRTFKLLQKIKPTFSKAYKVKDDKIFLDLTLKDIFSIELSERCTRFNKDHNKKQIALLYEKNEAKEVIEILNKSVKDMYIEYINNSINGFKLKDDLKIIRNKYENKDEKYVQRYEKTAKNFIKITNRKGRS